jgi:hypothetical protein
MGGGGADERRREVSHEAHQQKPDLPAAPPHVVDRTGDATATPQLPFGADNFALSPIRLPRDSNAPVEMSVARTDPQLVVGSTVPLQRSAAPPPTVEQLTDSHAHGTSTTSTDNSTSAHRPEWRTDKKSSRLVGIGPSVRVCGCCGFAGMLLVFDQNFALEDAIESHVSLLEASMRVTNNIPLGRPLSCQLTL